MRLNINLKSLTVEELLSMRKKELGEVLEMVGKDVSSRVYDGDMPRRLADVTVLQQDVSSEADESFNSNERFVETMQSAMALLPRFGDEIEVLQSHDETVFVLAAATPDVGTDTSNSNIRLLTGSLDGSSAVWGGTDNRRWQHSSPVLAMTILEPMGWFAVSLQDHSIDIVGETNRTKLAPGHAIVVTALQWVPDLQWLVSGAVDGSIIAWNLCGVISLSEALQIDVPSKQHFGHSEAVRDICWISPRRWVATASFDLTIKLWSTPDAPMDASLVVEPHLTQIGSLAGHQGPVTSLSTIAFDESESALGGRWLLSGSADRSIITWDLDSKEPVSEPRQQHALGVCALEALTRPKWIASGSADATVKIWQLNVVANAIDGQPLQLVKTMRGHSGGVHALACVPRKGWLASGSSDRTVRIWRVEEDLVR
jgi:WD40 repeat protein